MWQIEWGVVFECLAGRLVFDALVKSGIVALHFPEEELALSFFGLSKVYTPEHLPPYSGFAFPILFQFPPNPKPDKGQGR